jgi:hypothetical protein
MAKTIVTSGLPALLIPAWPLHGFLQAHSSMHPLGPGWALLLLGTCHSSLLLSRPASGGASNPNSSSGAIQLYSPLCAVLHQLILGDDVCIHSSYEQLALQAEEGILSI